MAFYKLFTVWKGIAQKMEKKVRKKIEIKNLGFISKTILRSFLLLIGGGIIGTLLLMLAYSLPLNDKNVEASLARTDEIKNSYPLVNVENHYLQYFNSYEPGVLDDATDFLILSKVFDEGQENLLWRVMDMQGYGRYWHGYISVLRPVFYFIDYFDFRILNGMLQIFLIMILSLLIWQKTEQMRYVLALLSSYALLMPVALGMSLQFSPVFYIAASGELAVLLKGEYLLDRYRYLYLFMILGMLTSYFDFLTYPLVTWAFPVCWALVLFGSERDMVGNLKMLIFSALSWGCGYVGFFIVKWVFASFVCGYDTFMQAFDAAMYRLGEADLDIRTYVQTYNRFEVLYTNWRHYQFIGYAGIIIAWILWALFRFIKYGWKIRSNSMALLLATLSSPAWYLLLSNHTTHHHYMTYRIYVASILAFILFLCGCAAAGKQETSDWKMRWKRMTLVGIMFCIGFGLSFLAKENVRGFYGDDNQELPIGEGDIYEIEFTPTFDNIKEIGFCLHGDDLEKGYYHVEVVDNGEICYQLEIPLSNYGQTYYESSVDWHLDPKKKYILRCYVEEVGSKKIRLLLTKDGEMPLTEFGKTTLNGKLRQIDTEPLSGIEYHTIVRSRLTKIYLAIVCGGYFTALAMGIIMAIRQKRALKDFY